jgi:hypothetical protein
MNKQGGEINLKNLITHMQPVLNEGEYVFVSVANIDLIPRNMTICEIKEKEGVTIVLSKDHAIALRLTYDYIASWITLNVHSSLAAVGLTAAFSSELAKHHISCNVIAGYYHDHIFVDQKDAQKALNVLLKLTIVGRN